MNDMLADGIIEPSNSPWASPITLVPKPDGTMHFCIDYCKVNAVTQRDSHPLPNIQDVFDGLNGAKIFSTKDTGRCPLLKKTDQNQPLLPNQAVISSSAYLLAW